MVQPLSKPDIERLPLPLLYAQQARAARLHEQPAIHAFRLIPFILKVREFPAGLVSPGLAFELNGGRRVLPRVEVCKLVLRYPNLGKRESTVVENAHNLNATRATHFKIDAPSPKIPRKIDPSAVGAFVSIPLIDREIEIRKVFGGSLYRDHVSRSGGPQFRPAARRHRWGCRPHGRDRASGRLSPAHHLPHYEYQRDAKQDENGSGYQREMLGFGRCDLPRVRRLQRFRLTSRLQRGELGIDSATLQSGEFRFKFGIRPRSS
jgi:hypothetical protein